MQVVIDIPEKEYELCRKYDGHLGDHKAISCAIANGTPLPKGHGRLIDADELKKHKYHDNNRFENAVAIAQVDWADTIIEAESEEK